MNALDVAIRMETDAIKFYQEAADKTSHIAGKRMFLSIREDEKRHLEMISALSKGMDITYKNAEPIKEVKTVFEQLKDQMQSRIKAASSDIEALETAMNMEKEGSDFYKKIASEAKDEKTKALFDRLIIEEEQHFRMFSNTYSFLNDTGNWFMWKEHSIVEG